jgi:translocation and assembly module TamB
MSRRARILRNAGIAIAGVLALLLVGAIAVVQTDWFQNYARQKIIAAVEEGTGGHAEVSSFRFDVWHLTAVLNGFVLHGTEPVGAPPFLRIRYVQVNGSLFTGVHHFWDITYLGVDGLEVSVIASADGRSNIPTPKKKSESNQPPLQTLVDTAIGHFELTDSSVSFASLKQKLDMRGKNLRAQLWYRTLNSGYQGRLSFQPLYVASGGRNPVEASVVLPVFVGADRVDFQGATVTSSRSKVRIDGSMENLRNPAISAHILGDLAWADLRDVGNLPLNPEAPGAPQSVRVDATAEVSSNRIDIGGLQVSAGDSNLSASGSLRDPAGRGAMEFGGRLDLRELSRLARTSVSLGGVLRLSGVAKLDQASNYQIQANVQGTKLAVRQGTQRIEDVDFRAAVQMKPGKLDVNELRLAAFGGVLTGDLEMRDFAQYEFHGSLRDFNIHTAAVALGQQLPYSGLVSGPLEVTGDPHRSTSATARLSIAPGRGGVPVSGRLIAAYSTAGNDIRLADSYIALPHSRLTLSGSLRSQMNISLASANLNDFLAAPPAKSRPQVSLAPGGKAAFSGTLNGGTTSPRIQGHLQMDQFAVQGRLFNRLSADVAASSAGAAIRNGSLRRGPMDAAFSGQVGLRNGKPTPTGPLQAQIQLRNGDLADIAAMAGQPAGEYAGALEGSASIFGTTGNPLGAATVTALSGVVRGEPFDRIQAQVKLDDRLVTVPAATFEAGNAKATLSAEYRHPADSFSAGNLHAHVESNQVDLARMRTLQRQRPGTSGTTQVNLDVTAGLQPSQFQVQQIAGDASVRNLRMEGQNYGDMTATVRTSGQTVTYQLASNLAGSDIRVNGSTQLTPEYPTTADGTVRSLPIERVLTLVQRTDIRARGRLSGDLHFSGTKNTPQGSAELTLVDAVLYDEPVSRLQAKVSYLPQALEVSRLDISAAGGNMQLTGRWDHPRSDFETGTARFQLSTNGVDLARIHSVQLRRPDLSGTVGINASGSARLRANEPKILVDHLDARVEASDIASGGKSFGGFRFDASTERNTTRLTLASTLAGTSIQGRGTVQLDGRYPLEGELTFNGVQWARISELIGQDTGGGDARFDIATDGRIDFRGPALAPEQVQSTLQLTRLELGLIRGPEGLTGARQVTLRNQCPVTARLDHKTVHLESLHLAGPQSDIRASGTVALTDLAMNVSVNAQANLAVLQGFDRDITSSGNVAVAAVARGTASSPLVNGKLEIHNGSFNYASVPNGIANANGTIVFNGNSATVRDLTAETGGGRLTASGFVLLGRTMRFGLRANAENVRVRPQQGVSVMADSSVNLTGTSASSRLTGTVTINGITYAPRTDLGSLLTRAAPPVQTPATPSPLLDNLKLDIRVVSSNSLAVRASVAESLQSQVDLRVRGTASEPSLLGRVTITQGKLNFFGSTYRVNLGTISFYNPIRIEPVLDIALQTNAKGVDVTLQVTGPVDNMKLSYSSDPPLQFQEIVSLLASGKTPTSDPTILANQPSTPPQTYEQMGESALVSKAIADPVAGQLQRLFGVSQLKIDPTFTSGSQLPQAQLTLQQQVASNIVFTYVSALDNANAQTIKVEVSLNPHWAAVANRDQNGIFSINLIYKKEFR